MTKAELEAYRDELAERCKQDLYEVPAGMVDYSDIVMVFKEGWDAAMERFPKWIPVSEGLPPKGESRPVKTRVGEVFNAVIKGDGWYCVDSGNPVFPYPVIEWQELPEAHKP